MTMTELLKPIVIGDYFDGGEFGWTWYHPNHSRLAIIGDNKLSPKREMVKQFAKTFQSRDQKTVYWVTGEEMHNKPSEPQSGTAIPWVEELPDPSEEFADREIFINNRKFFSSSFLQLLCKSRGVDRKEVLPSIAYRSHLEGPLYGQIRAIEKIEDEDLRQWFSEQFSKLESIEWYSTKEQGRKFYVNRSENIYETALSFLTGLWSFWSETAKMDDPQMLVLIVEPPKELLMYSEDPIIREITSEALQIMKYLTEELTLTLILASETMFPVPEQNYRYKILFQTHESDFNLWTEENQQVMQYPPLYEAWNSGRREAGVFEDIYNGTRYALYFREDNMRVMDEFDGEIV